MKNPDFFVPLEMQIAVYMREILIISQIIMNYFQTPFSTRFNRREYNNCIGTIRTNIKANRFGKNATHLRCPEALDGRTRFQIIIMICFY